MAEQVSHHPPISAFYCSSTKGDYEVEGCLNPRLKFWGKSVEIKPEGETFEFDVIYYHYCVSGNQLPHRLLCARTDSLEELSKINWSSD